MTASYLDRTLGMSLGELLNEGRVSPRTDHLLWRLESAIGGLPLGPLLVLLEPSPQLEFKEFQELRDSLALDARAMWEWEHA